MLRAWVAERERKDRGMQGGNRLEISFGAQLTAGARRSWTQPMLGAGRDRSAKVEHPDLFQEHAVEQPDAADETPSINGFRS